MALEAIAEEIGRIKGPFFGVLWIDPLWALSANAMESFCLEEIMVVSGSSSALESSRSSCSGVEMLRLVSAGETGRAQRKAFQSFHGRCAWSINWGSDRQSTS
jgi:hypothetical protein